MTSLRGKKVVVAMSGGVDSSVAAALLKDQGASVVGCFMRLGSEDEPEHSGPQTCSTPAHPTAGPKPNQHGCCSVNDAADARLVAALLDIPFYVLNFKRDFNRVIDYFVSEYNAGRTPNPCVRCNDWLKFGKLFAYARSIDADFVATGHYARIDHSPNLSDSASPSALLRGVDHSKDQSYVLFGTPRDHLARMLLPIGDMLKPAVRKIAEEKNLPVFQKPDSQEICFVPDNNYARLIEKRTPDQLHPGTVIDPAGRTVGSHEGHQHFTIGQRRGVGVALGHPVYVVDKNIAQNTVTVGPRESLFSTGLTADQTNWLVDLPAFNSGRPPTELAPLSVEVKIRYNSPPVKATLAITGESSLSVRFDAPQPAVSPGQAVVCYHNHRVLGGGWIQSPLKS